MNIFLEGTVKSKLIRSWGSTNPDAPRKPEGFPELGFPGERLTNAALQPVKVL